ncbi:MAG: STN domain-containing protein, partial [Gluconobacter japonicus]|uniref:STN domain-containing protein n=1 Tax=Gluconobacter japonicus TaxID=376620 RepID=UPI0039ED9433
MAVNVRCPLRAALFLTVGMTILTHTAVAASAGTANVHIDRQPMAQALESLSRQTGQSILFSPDLVEHLQAPSVSGSLTPDEAAGKLLNGSGLTVEVAPSGGMIVRRTAGAKRPARARRAPRSREAHHIEQSVCSGARTRSGRTMRGGQVA